MNLVPLRKTHHTLVHARAYIIHRLAPGQYSFTDPSTGRVIAPPGTLPEAGGPIDGTHTADITAGTIQQALGEQLDLHFAVWVALRVYAGASGHQKIITSRHNPDDQTWPPVSSSDYL